MAEADISRQTKKMLLFVSPENGFWAKIFKHRSPSQNEIAGYLDIAKGTIPGWKNGRQVDLQTAEDAFATVLRRLNAPVAESPPLTTAEIKETETTLSMFRSDFYNDAVSIYATAEHLGMRTQVSQQIIDEVIYRRAPVFPRMYSAAGPATSVFHTYQGVYMIWVRRLTGNGHSHRIWLQAPLRVRYPLQIGTGYLVRCKLNAPLINPELPKTYWEYDGFLVKKASRIFWLFEKRDPDTVDQFHFITGTGRPFRRAFGDGDKTRTMSGTYLTTEQDENQKITSDRIILQRVLRGAATERSSSPREMDEAIRIAEERMKEIMHSAAVVIDDGERCSTLDALLEDFDRPID